MCALVALLLSLHALSASAATTCGATFQTLSEALAQCEKSKAQNAGNGISYQCTTRGTTSTMYFWYVPSGGGVYIAGSWSFCTNDSGAICSARPSYQTSQPGNLTLCQAGCSYAPAPGKETWTVRGITGGSSAVGSGRMVPTGQTCGSGPVEAADPKPADQAVPKLCGGGSCVDTASGQACAVNGAGQQVCVKLPKGTPGTCATGGDTTLCAGNPAPSPPNPPITDPASQIASSDHFTQQAGEGPINNNTVNNYNNTGNGANSGKGAGDVDGKGDKPDDQKKDDGTTASGGGDCTTPPMVEGSAALGMVARQAWLLRCAEAGKGGDDSDTTVPGLDGIGETPGDGFKKEITVLDKLDVTGFGGGGTCPRLPDIDLGRFGHLSMNGDWWCDFLSKVGYVVLLVGMFLALWILGTK